MSIPLLAQHAPGDRVAFGAAGSRTAAELQRDVAAVAAALPEPAGDALALFSIRRDRYAWVAAVLGAWTRGYTVAMPGADVTREQFLRLAQHPSVGIVLHDTLSTAALRIDRLLDAEHAGGTRRTLLPPVRDGALKFLRSEAGHELDVAPLHLSELSAEALALARQLELPERASCIASVQAETRFGLVLGCLWPLLTGGAFWRDDPRAGGWVLLPDDELDAPVRRVLVSVPAHVRVWLRAPERPLAHAGWLISGGSPLPSEASTRVREYAALKVRDACAVEPASGATLASGGPQRFCRSDWALALEERIAWLDGVSEAALIALGSESAPRLYLAVVAAGCSEQQLRSRLAQTFGALEWARILVLEPYVLPPSAATPSFTGSQRGLERNGMGEHDRASVLRLFDLDSAGQPLSFALELRPEPESSLKRTEPGAPDQYVFGVQVPADYGYFAGHFPGHPILPGAAQLSELVLPCVRNARPDLGRLLRMARLKFQERILPGDHVDVVLTCGADPAQLDFALRRGASVCAAGRLTFERPLLPRQDQDQEPTP